MAQEIINTGAAANDGTGDPLRTAFIKTDNNFDQIWAAGPVGTNVRISGNTITTLTVNTDLVLSPNGAANVRLNNNTIPGANNTWYLGSATNRWRGIYVNSVDAGNITVSGSLAVPGDLTVGGNLTVEGDTIQIGNIVTDTKTIQLSNTAANGAQANGSGITVGANDSIATLLYNSASNVWTTNIGANVTGNVTANYFIGNGALLTGVTNYGNANVADYLPTYLPTYFGNIGAAFADFTGNITVGNRISVGPGNGNIEIVDDSAFNGPTIKTPGGSGLDLLLEPSGNLLLSPDGGEVIVEKQTASTNFNTGALLVYGGIGADGNINISGNVSAAGWTGNLIPSANAVYSLGNSTMYWSNLWVSNNTIYIGGVPLGMSAGNVLTVNGEAVLSNDSDATITTTGNISADYITASGNIVTGNIYSSGNVSIYADNIELTSYFGPCNFSTTYTIDSQGWFNLPGNIFSVRYANGSQVDLGSDTGFFTFDETTMSVPDDSSMTLQVRDDDQAVRSSLLLDSNDGLTRLSSLSSEQDTSYNTGNWSTATWTGNDLQFIDAPDIVAFVDTGDYNNSVNRTFSINGGPRLPYDGASYGGDNITFYTSVAADPDPTTVTTIEFFYQYQSRIQMDHDDEEIVIQAQGMDIIIIGDDDISIEASDNIDIEAGGSIDIDSQEQIDIRSYSTTESVRIITDADNVTRTWDFGADGDLSAPGDITVVGDVTGTSGASTLVLRAQPESNTSIQLNNIVDSTISTAANLDIVTDSSNTAQTWQFDTTGNLRLPGMGGGRLWPNDGYATLQGDSGAEFLWQDAGDPTLSAYVGAESHKVYAVAVSSDLNQITEVLVRPNSLDIETSGNATVTTGGASSGNVWTFESDASLTVPGNINFGGDSSAAPSLNDWFSITSAGDFDIVTGTASTPQTFEFDAGGNLTVPGNVVGNVAGFAIGYRDIPQVAFTGNATIAAADAGKHFYSTQSTDYVLTIADNSAVSWPVGTAVTVVNRGTGNITVAQAAGVSLYLAGNSSAGNRTVTTYGMATVLNVAANVWMINGTGVS